MLDNLQEKISKSFDAIRGKGKLTQENIDEVTNNIRAVLIDADVSLSVVEDFIENVKTRANEVDLSKAINPAQTILKLVNEQLIEILGGSVSRGINYSKSGPTVIMLVGLQGSGKTTLAGKLGFYLKKQNRKPMLVAADLQRPNAVDQLRIVGENAGVEVFAPEEGTKESDDSEQEEKRSIFGNFFGRRSKGDPVKVAKDSIKYAESNNFDTIVIDTAGRLAVDEELMEQVKNIRDVVNPDEIFFVIDSMIGQDAVLTAKSFDDKVNFTATVLTKLDGDARGGSALSVVGVTHKPIIFSSVGEKISDLEPFYPDRMASRILDMGDILSLIEKAEESFDESSIDALEQKILGEQEFDFNDYLDQIDQLKKMGSFKSVAKMLPGMAKYSSALDQFDEHEFDLQKAMIQSMTPYERTHPKELNGSRRKRIANGSGVSASKVNALLDQFDKVKKMFNKMSAKAVQSGGLGVPGMGNFSGFDSNLIGYGGKKNKKKGKKNKKNKKGVSGNPAKRAKQK